MNNIYFFIPCDIYVRDFDSRLLIALSVMKNIDNVKFVIGSQVAVNKFIIQNNNIKKMIYYEKGIDQRYSNWYYYLANRGCLIYTLSEEGGIFEKNRHLIDFNIDTNNLDFIKKNFIWSDFIFDQIKKEKKIFFNHSEFLVTGNPRFDLCAEQFNNFYDDFLNRYKKKKCIVISSTFTSGNSHVSDEYNIIRLFSKTNFLKEVYFFDAKRRKYSNSLRKYFISLTKEISNENPNIQIFFRPHPMESHEIYNREFKEYKNITVNNSVSARDMIAISDTLIHHDCTTAIESYLNNKKPIAYLPIFDDYLAQEIPIKLSQVTKKIEEVKYQLHKILYENENTTLPKNHLKYFLKNFEAKSYEKIANTFITDIKNFDKFKVKKKERKKIDLLKYSFRFFSIRTLSTIIRIFSKFSNKKLTKCAKFSKQVESSELDKKIKTLSKIISLQKKVKIDKLKENLFLLKTES